MTRSGAGSFMRPAWPVMAPRRRETRAWEPPSTDASGARIRGCTVAEIQIRGPWRYGDQRPRTGCQLLPPILCRLPWPGPEGNPALNSPRLVGADDWYIVSQLEAFRSGSRGNDPRDRTGKQMRVMAVVLPDSAAVASVAAYIRSLEQ